jgi:hypothetical protein
VGSYAECVALHPAENRGYRELYLTGRQLIVRWRRLASRLGEADAADQLERGASSVERMLEELAPLTARYDLHGGVAAQGGGANIGIARAAVADRFLERNQALRFAVSDLDHLATLLAYLAEVSDARGDAELPEFCRGWERKLRRQVSAIRKLAIELGRRPDEAILPVDPSALGRAAHGMSYAFGTAGEWIDRQLARSKRD